MSVNVLRAQPSLHIVGDCCFYAGRLHMYVGLIVFFSQKSNSFAKSRYRSSQQMNEWRHLVTPELITAVLEDKLVLDCQTRYHNLGAQSAV